MFSPSKTTSSTTHMPLISFPSKRGSYGTTSSSSVQAVSYFKEQKSENFEDLPKDVLCKIMQFIDSKEMDSLLSTCSRMLLTGLSNETVLFHLSTADNAVHKGTYRDSLLNPLHAQISQLEPLVNPNNRIYRNKMSVVYHTGLCHLRHPKLWAVGSILCIAGSVSLLYSLMHQIKKSQDTLDPVYQEGRYFLFAFACLFATTITISLIKMPIDIGLSLHDENMKKVTQYFEDKKSNSSLPLPTENHVRLFILEQMRTDLDRFLKDSSEICNRKTASARLQNITISR